MDQLKIGKFIAECRLILPKGTPLFDVYADSAEQTLIGGMKTRAVKEHWGVEIHNARKKPINDRIRFYCILQGADRYKVLKNCKATIEAFEEAMWDSKEITADVRLDNGTTNIDSLDAQEYSTEPYMADILKITR